MFNKISCQRKGRNKKLTPPFYRNIVLNLCNHTDSLAFKFLGSIHFRIEQQYMYDALYTYLCMCTYFKFPSPLYFFTIIFVDIL